MLDTEEAHNFYDNFIQAKNFEEYPFKPNIPARWCLIYL